MTRLLLAAALLAVAADVRADPPGPSRRQKGDLAIRARAVLARYCAECHTGNPDAGQSLLAVKDYPKLKDKTAPVPFVTAGDPDRSLVLQLVRDGSMPPGGRPRPSEEDIAALEAWVKADAPSYPRAFDDRATLAAMLDDLDRQPADDQPFLRYVSLAHLVPDAAPPPDLAAAEWALARALTEATGRTDAPPAPVDDTATLFRLDTRKYGWDARGLFKVDVPATGAKADPIVTPFDLILLEYPFAAAPPYGPDADRLDRFFTASKQLRPVPFLRGDWLTSALVRDKAPLPLAEELKALGKLAEWTQKKSGSRPPGPPARPFTTDPKAIPDGPAPFPSFGAWYARDVAPTPAPFTLTAEIIGIDTKPTDTVKVNQPFQLRAKADRDVYVVVLQVIGDGAARVAKLAGGDAAGGIRLRAGEDARLRPAGVNAFQVASILADGPAVREHFVLLASPDMLPIPAVIQSDHARSEVWRFLPEQGKDFNPAQTVRKVVTYTVVPKK